MWQVTTNLAWVLPGELQQIWVGSCLVSHNRFGSGLVWCVTSLGQVLSEESVDLGGVCRAPQVQLCCILCASEAEKGTLKIDRGGSGRHLN